MSKKFCKSSFEYIIFKLLNLLKNVTACKYELSFYELLNKKGVSVAKVDSDQEGYFYFRVAVQEHKVNKIFIKCLKEIGSKNIKKFER